MKLTDLRVGALSLPLVRPFQTALRRVERLESVLVRLETDDGLAGYGEAPPTAAITGDTLGSIRHALECYIRPALMGTDAEDLDGVQARLHGCLAGNFSAKAAADMALYDLLGKAWGLPLWRLLGGARRSLVTDLTISAGSAEQMSADAVSAVEAGFSILKIKLGLDPLRDLARVHAVRRAVGPDVTLRVDANQGWSPKEAVRLIRKMEDAGLTPELVEQPVAARDLDGMRFVTRRVTTPILADESVWSAADAVRVLQTGAADWVNLKLMKTGGIWQALKVCAVAESLGGGCMVGCMLESRLAVSAAAHLAAGRGWIGKVDLDGPALCRPDPFPGGPAFRGEGIWMNDLPGLGFDGDLDGF